MTSDPDLKVTAFFEVKYLKNIGKGCYSTLIGNLIHNIWNGTMFGELH